MSATLFQPEPSAKAPCTRTTFLICCVMTILLCSKGPFGLFEIDVAHLSTNPPLPCAQDGLLTCAVRAYWLPPHSRPGDRCGGGSLFDELGRFLRVRHIGHV